MVFIRMFFQNIYKQFVQFLSLGGIFGGNKKGGGKGSS